MADNGKIDVDGLPARPAGNLDSIVGVDRATRQAAQFPVTALPMPQGVVSAIQQQNATIEAIRASQGSGLPSYATRAALPAPGTLPPPAGGGDPLVTVTNDPTAANNGAWRDTGSEWVQSADRTSQLIGTVGEMVTGTQPVGVARQMSGPDDLVVRDSVGHVIARINTLGMVLMGMVATTDLDSGEYVIKDGLGFVMLRVNPDGVWHMGRRVRGISEEDLLDIQPGVELARTAVRRVGPRDMPSWRRARALAVQGRGHARFACIGDSNTMGGWALGSGQHRRALSVPALLAPMLHPALGATSENYIGRALSGTSGYSTYDPRLTVGAGWTATGAASAGGESWVNTTTTNAMQFEPSAPWQRADVWVKLTAAAELSIGVAGSMQTFTPAVGSVVRLSYEAPTLADQALQIIRVSGSAAVIGWDCFADDQHGVSLINMGRSGWRSDQYAPVIDDVVAMAPDAAYVQLGLNDFNQNIDPAAFAANLDVILDALSGAGIDAAIVVSFQPGSSKPWPWSDYVAVMDAAARSRGLPLIDIGERFGPHSAAMADGLVTDNLHPNAAGYGDTAVLISNYLNL